MSSGGTRSEEQRYEWSGRGRENIVQGHLHFAVAAGGEHFAVRAEGYGSG